MKMFTFSHNALLLFYAHVSIVSFVYKNYFNNTASKAKRDQIVDLKTAGTGNSDISKQFDACRKTVFSVCKRYIETAITFSKLIPGRKRSI